jgi:hypothetical protein
MIRRYKVLPSRGQGLSLVAMVDGAAQENNGTPYILEALYNC